MSYANLAKRIDELQSSWVQFKDLNEKRLEEIKQKGAADPLTNEALDRVNTFMDECKEKIDYLEKSNVRPAIFADKKSESVELTKERKALDNYIRTGTISPYSGTKSLSSSTSNDGGYFLGSNMSQDIIGSLNDVSPMRHLSSIENISSNQYEVVVDNSSVQALWSTGNAEISVNNSDISGDLDSTTISLYNLYTQPQITQDLIDDVYFDLEAWINQRIVDAFSVAEGKAFISGRRNGATTGPSGILSYSATTLSSAKQYVEISNLSNVKLLDYILDLYYKLDPAYSKNASLLMHRDTIQQLRKEKTTDGQYIWNPRDGENDVDTVFGIPVYQEDNIDSIKQTVHTYAKPVRGKNTIAVLADFKRAYRIVEHPEMKVIRDPYTKKPFIKFYVSKRVGAAVVNINAIKYLVSVYGT